MPQWTDAAGKPSPFPTEAPPSSSIANFRKKEDALIGDLSGSIDAKNAAATEAVYTTKTTSELSFTRPFSSTALASSPTTPWYLQVRSAQPLSFHSSAAALLGKLGRA